MFALMRYKKTHHQTAGPDLVSVTGEKDPKANLQEPYKAARFDARVAARVSKCFKVCHSIF
jgi:hypothetical protein